MKKNNVWHITWIIGIYATLITILLLVVEYKVKWEDKDLSTYLYFYRCSSNLCTTDNRILDYYSKVKCENEECPYITEKKGNYVILSTSEKEYVYDYIKGEVISDIYNKYSFIDEYLLAQNNESKYGIIDYENNIQVDFEYNKITDYKDNYLAYAENSKIGIINSEKNIDVKPAYEFVQLVNDSLYIYKEENKYFVASYSTELPINNESYNFVYGANNSLIVIKDKKLDIVDTNLKSKLLLKLDTYYEYTKEKERESLNIYIENNLLHFTIASGENGTNYIYDLKNNKLFS